ncbi:MAG: dihydropteroate synthase [Thermoplasmatota archaeon]
MGPRTLVMGIVNVTPDSFSDGGKFLEKDRAVRHAATLVSEGADILDIGGESTRPGAPDVGAEEELARVLPVIRALRTEISIPLSIDTRKSEVAAACLDAGAAIVNDVSGLRDPAMVDVVASRGAGLVIMHMRGDPQTMQQAPTYRDVVTEVGDFLAGQARAAMSGGVAREAIVLDPGIGFGKTVEHNLELLRGIPRLRARGFPVLMGHSRKSFIGKLTGDRPAEDRLEGSLAAATLSAAWGADIVRVHDVRETVRVLKVADALCRPAAGEPSTSRSRPTGEGSDLGTSSRIRVSGIPVRARIGVTERERAVPRTLLMDCEFDVPWVATDALHATTDYAAASHAAVRAVQAREWLLLESAAQAAALAVRPLTHGAVVIRIRKRSPPGLPAEASEVEVRLR